MPENQRRKWQVQKQQTAGHPRCSQAEQDHTLEARPQSAPRMPRKASPLTPMLSFILRTDLQQEGRSPTQRSREPGNHGAGVHSGLSGSRSPLPLPHKAPASNPNPGESRRELLRASRPIPGLQLILRCFSRIGQVRKEDCSPP